MDDRVPGFEEMEEDCAIPTTTVFSRPKKLAGGEDEIMELLWQNGQVVLQNSSKRNPFAGGEAPPPPPPADVRELRPNESENQLFMQEDEMSAWLHCPLDDSSFDRDLYSDLIYSTPPPVTAVTPPRTTPEIRPQLPPPPPPPRSFGHFSRSKPVIPSENVVRASTVVESNELGSNSRVSHTAATACRTEAPQFAGASANVGNREFSLPASPSISRASFSASPQPRADAAKPKPAPVDRTRKSREDSENECHSEDIEIEAKNPGRGSSSVKRCRAAEVHNLSERRRRDRINEKMKALQQLIPRCNKSDKASMLDEAIEYLKSLQMQVQMMSMGYGMMPMMYPGMQQFMPAMGMGMGMGMDMGMNRPMIPYPHMLPGSNMGPRFPVPGYHLPHAPVDPSRIPSSNQMDPTVNSNGMQNSNQMQMPNFLDPYQQFPGIHQAQFPSQQNQTMVHPSFDKPGTSKETENPENQQPGRK